MQNRIEYLKAKYSKPINDSILYHIASDLVDGRKRLIDVFPYKPRTLLGTRRQKVKIAIKEIRKMDIELKTTIKGRERHSLQLARSAKIRSVRTNFPRREKAKAL